MDDRFGRLFYLVHDSGDHLYPVRMKNRDSGVSAFRLSKGGTGGNTKANGREENNEAKVLDLVKSGWAVRASTKNGSRSGLYKLSQRSIAAITEL